MPKYRFSPKSFAGGLFTAKNFLEAFAPLFYLTRWAGLTPFTTQMLNGRPVVKFWIPYLIWTLLLVIAYVSLSFTTQENAGSVASVLYGSNSIERVSDYFEMFASALSIFIIFIAFSIRRNSFAEMLHLMVEADLQFRQIDVHISFARIQAKLALLVFCHTALTIIIIIGGYIAHRISDVEPHVSSWFCYYFINYANSVLIVSFVVNLSILKDNFKRINVSLHNLAEEVEFRNAKVEKIPFVDRSTWARCAEGDTDYRISMLCSLHDKLCDLAELIDYSFNIQILTVITTGFINIVINLYYVLNGLSENIDAVRALFITYNIQTCFYNFVNIVLVSFSCTKNHEEGKESAILAYRLLNKDNINYSTRKKLIQFSMQIKHRSPSYSAFGMFPLDSSLIYKVVGSTTTYLIIVVQFAISTKNVSNSIKA